MISAGCYSGRADFDGAADSSPGSSGAGDGGGDQGSGGEAPVEPVAPEVLERVGPTGLRRLTAAEYTATVRDLLGVEVDASLLLPEDWREPFDNDYTTQIASQALIEAAELLSSDIAAEVLASEATRDAAVGCTPASATDAECFRSFVASLGRRALRRPMSAQEIDRYAALLGEADESGDFYMAVEVVLRSLLQHPEFLYRVELGRPVPDAEGVHRLGDYELASRLSYLLWGSMPSDALFELAERGELHESAQLAAAADVMLDDPRARARLGRFHAMWLGYEHIPLGPSLADPMREETQALIDRIIFDQRRPWQDLLRASETFVDPTLAEHYGLVAPEGASDWVDYGDSGRQGLLSHGSFLSAVSLIDDSSPTKRGILVRTRMMCQLVPPPPPDVDVDDTEPAEGQCKEDFYRESHAQGNCAGCHSLFDPIGLGLENYDHRGAFREVENDDPTCEISGEGMLDGVPFSGPAELSDLLLDSGSLNACVTTQLYRFAVGRSTIDDVDQAFIDQIVDEFGRDADMDLREMLIRFVSDEAFTLRREESSAPDSEGQ